MTKAFSQFPNCLAECGSGDIRWQHRQLIFSNSQARETLGEIGIDLCFRLFCKFMQSRWCLMIVSSVSYTSHIVLYIFSLCGGLRAAFRNYIGFKWHWGELRTPDCGDEGPLVGLCREITDGASQSQRDEITAAQ